MPATKELTIRAEFTGEKPNLKPAAQALVRMIKKVTNADGTFTDPGLEAEFQAWMKARAGKESA